MCCFKLKNWVLALELTTKVLISAESASAPPSVTRGLSNPCPLCARRGGRCRGPGANGRPSPGAGRPDLASAAPYLGGAGQPSPCPPGRELGDPQGTGSRSPTRTSTASRRGSPHQPFPPAPGAHPSGRTTCERGEG